MHFPPPSNHKGVFPTSFQVHGVLDLFTRICLSSMLPFIALSDYSPLSALVDRDRGFVDRTYENDGQGRCYCIIAY